jgi:hypothetical protein
MISLFLHQKNHASIFQFSIIFISVMSGLIRLNNKY